jgi:nucleoside-diphosphate-sugar epimerase
VVDNFQFGQPSLLDCCHYEHLKIVRGDVRDEKLMLPLLAKADVIVPLACLVGAPLCAQRPMEARSINLDAITMLINHSSQHQRFLSPTTNSGYGIGEAGIECTEETPLRPVSLYGVLKVELEKHLLDSGRAISFRLATAFGVSPRMRVDLLVNDFTYRAVTDRFVVLFEAHFKRNYIHVRDVSRAFLHGLDHWDTMKAQAYNVGLERRQPDQDGVVPGDQKAHPRVHHHGGAGGQGPRPAQLHGEQCQTGGHGLPDHPQTTLGHW